MPDLLQELLERQYVGEIALRLAGGGYFFGPDYTLAPSPQKWSLVQGQYNVPHAGNIYGYWIFRPDARLCWQAVDDGGGNLQNWNQDGKAAGDPEDWELFSFELADPDERSVRIYNTRSRWYVGLLGNTFNCANQKNTGTQFLIEFS